MSSKIDELVTMLHDALRKVGEGIEGTQAALQEGDEAKAAALGLGATTPIMELNEVTEKLHDVIGILTSGETELTKVKDQAVGMQRSGTFDSLLP